VNVFSQAKDEGQITVATRKKKKEIIEEKGYRVEVPPDVGEQEKEALEQTGDDATQGW
jgi:hypothetical protein